MNSHDEPQNRHIIQLLIILLIKSNKGFFLISFNKYYINLLFPKVIIKPKLYKKYKIYN